MMIHEKLLADQFLLDFKNGNATTHQAQSLLHFPPHSPPMDYYAAYSMYNKELHQQLMNSQMPMANPLAIPQSIDAEVLDLSRRDLADLERKTPSPYHTNSSLSSVSPVPSPNSSNQSQHLNNRLPANLLLSLPSQNVNNLNLAALYSGIYYPAAVKQESVSTTTPTVTSQPIMPAAPVINQNNLLQTFATTGVAASHSPPAFVPTTTATTPTSSSGMLSNFDVRNTRPFKAFPRDPSVLAANFAATDILLDNRREPYSAYRKRVLDKIRSNNGGARTVTNIKMRRTNSTSSSINECTLSNNSENEDHHQHEECTTDNENSEHEPQTSESSHDRQTTTNSLNSLVNSTSCSSGSVVKDAAYYERRRKNNAAAKKSRDRRRIKEDEIAIRAAYLERQNIELTCQNKGLKAQNIELTCQNKALEAQLAAYTSKNC